MSQQPTPAICEFSDLPVLECAHCTGATLADPLPIRWEGTDREAAFAGLCAECGGGIAGGAEVVLADVDDNGLSRRWCHRECTRMAGTGKC